MVFPTSLRLAAFACAVPLLSGCMAGGMLSSMGGVTAHGARAPSVHSVADGALRLKGPDGYCIDADASHATTEGGFALMGSCRALSAHPRDPHPEQPMVLTVSVAPGAPVVEAEQPGLDMDATEAFLTSEAGTRSLSRAPEDNRATVTRVLREPGVLFLRVEDTAPSQMGAVEPGYWRAVLTLRGHVVMATAMSLSSRPVGEEAGLTQLRALVSALQTANPERGQGVGHAAGRAMAALTDRFRGRNNQGAGSGKTTPPLAAASRPVP